MAAQDYPQPNATVDVALFTLTDGRLGVLLARRDREPFAGSFALPGGYVHADEDDSTLQTARRVLVDKAGIVAPYLEQLYTFSGKFRDPRGWSLSVSYYAVVPEGVLAATGSPDLLVAPVDSLPALPFDHGDIIRKGVARLRGKASYSSLPVFLLPEQFTLGELFEVYRQVGVELDKVSFRRKIEAQGIIGAVPGQMRHGAHRPAQLYRRAEDTLREFDQVLG
jgi:8-oxo-dGTP diphosphatase